MSYIIYMTFLFRDYLRVLDDEDRDKIERLKGEEMNYRVEDIERELEMMEEEGIQLYTIVDREPIPQQGDDIHNRPQIMKYRGSSVLNEKAIPFVLKKFLYADDSTLTSSSLVGAQRSTLKHKRAAALGKLEIHPDKLLLMRLVGDEEQQKSEEIMKVDDTIVKETTLEKYLGSRFTCIYDGGTKNITIRVMIAHNKMKKLERFWYNKELSYEIKIQTYRSDILSILLHGAEYWHLDEKNIQKLEGFQRKTILQIVGRNYRDHITSVDMYEWMHKRRIYIYPVRFILAERKLRYFAMIERGKVNEIARRVYWSDIVTSKVKDKDFEYEHISDIKKALKILLIEEREMNSEFKDKKVWQQVVNDKKLVAYKEWVLDENIRYAKEKEILINNGEYKKRKEQELDRNKGWIYKKRGMPEV